jgi:AraC-like DNA-binding protein
MPATDLAARWPVFETADADLAGEWMTAAYGTSIRMSGLARGTVLRSRRTMLGDVAFDHSELPMKLSFTAEPFQRLTVLHVRTGVMEREGGVSERSGPDDITVVADPGLPFAVRTENAVMDTVTLDLMLLRGVAADSSESAPVQLHFTSYRPTSLAGGRFWRTTVAYARNITAHPDAAASPLIVGSVRRLLAASALATFPNTIVPDPTPGDRNDATPTTLRRAITFIEARAGDDIGLIDIARAACVTPRAVQITFRRHLNTTPMTYLRRVRLDRAREQLRAADPSQGSTVTAVAARWGFASPSRFTVHYRALYGELPSHTLRGDI